MELIIGHKGEEHITSSQVAQMLRAMGIGGSGSGAFFDSPTMENESAFEVSASGHTVTIGGGVGMIQGRAFCIPEGESEIIELEPCSADKHRTGYIVARYTVEDGIEDISIEAIYGEEGDEETEPPSYVDGNIDDGDSPVEYPLFQFYQYDGSMTDIIKFETEVKSLASIKQDYSENVIQFGDLLIQWGTVEIADMEKVTSSVPYRYTTDIYFDKEYKYTPAIVVNVAGNYSAHAQSVPVYTNADEWQFSLSVYRQTQSTQGRLSWLAIGVASGE